MGESESILPASRDSVRWVKPFLRDETPYPAQWKSLIGFRYGGDVFVPPGIPIGA